MVNEERVNLSVKVRVRVRDECGKQRNGMGVVLSRSETSSSVSKYCGGDERQ